ncbi:MAG: hypothetical protein KDD47_14220 [Acidobacteria bacterium]|nr:hypothetical protein [Acidobacteriota bacterium]
MKPKLRQQLGDWLDAEAAGKTQEADRACRQTFQLLPSVALPQGMTERVVAAVLEAVPRRRDPFRRPAVRWAIAASLLVTALVAGSLPIALARAGSRVTVGTCIDFLQNVLQTLSSLVASVPSLWSFLSDLARLGAGAAGSPVFVLGLASLAGLSLVVFRLLSDLSFRQKGLSHVDAV